MGKYIQHPSVQRVVAALSAAGQTEDVIELEETARSAEEAAKALGVEVGAIVKTLISNIAMGFFMFHFANNHCFAKIFDLRWDAHGSS